MAQIIHSELDAKHLPVGTRVHIPGTGIVRLTKLDMTEFPGYYGLAWDYRICKKAPENRYPDWTGGIILPDMVGIEIVEPPKRARKKQEG